MFEFFLLISVFLELVVFDLAPLWIGPFLWWYFWVSVCYCPSSSSFGLRVLKWSRKGGWELISMFLFDCLISIWRMMWLLFFCGWCYGLVFLWINTALNMCVFFFLLSVWFSKDCCSYISLVYCFYLFIWHFFLASVLEFWGNLEIINGSSRRT